MSKEPPTAEHYLFHCKNPDCRKPILLHIEMLWQQPGIQRFQATGIPSLAIVCAHCNHAESYSTVKDSPNFDPMATTVSTDRMSYGIRAGEFECDVADCKIPLPLFVFGSLPTEADKKQALVDTWNWNVKCHHGHSIPKPNPIRG